MHTSGATENFGSGSLSFPLYPRNQYPYVSISIIGSAPRNPHARSKQYSLCSSMWLNPETQVNVSQEFPHQVTPSPNSSTRVCTV